MAERDARPQMRREVVLAVQLSLNEAIEAAVNGLNAAQMQLAAARRLPKPERATMVPAIEAQRDYWQNVVSGLRWAISLTNRRMKWPATIHQAASDGTIDRESLERIRTLLA